MDDATHKRTKAAVLAVLAVGTGVVYGITARLVFGQKAPVPDALVVMSVAFIFTVPFTMGFLVTAVCWIGGLLPWYFRLLTPPLAASVALALSLVFNYEGIICIILWSPVYFVLTFAGSLIAEGLFQVRRAWRARSVGVACILAAAFPYATALVESRFAIPQEVRTVEESTAIRADAETVWRHVREVKRIAPHEHRPTATHRIGFPRPVEAVLVGEGVGATRLARFDGDVLFVETITTWDPPHEIAFTISADADSIPATTLDAHVTVGGPYFDVLEGRFRIEPSGDGTVQLHLASRHRLSTPFNVYAHLWTDFVMRDVQREILRIVRARCEADAAARDAHAGP